MSSAQVGLLGSNYPAVIDSGFALNAKQSFFSELAFKLSSDERDEELNKSLDRLTSWLRKVDDYVCFELLLFKGDTSVAMKKLNLENLDPYEVFVYICSSKVPTPGTLSGETLLELKRRENNILELVKKIKAEEARLAERQKLISFLEGASEKMEERFFELNPNYGNVV